MLLPSKTFVKTFFFPNRSWESFFLRTSVTFYFSFIYDFDFSYIIFFFMSFLNIEYKLFEVKDLSLIHIYVPVSSDWLRAQALKADNFVLPDLCLVACYRVG